MVDSSSTAPAIPVDTWVWVEVGDDRLLAFTYRDAATGLSARGGVLREGAEAEAIEAIVRRPDRTVRLRGRAFPVRPLTASERDHFELDVRPPWAGPVAASDGPAWRGDADLEAHPDYPDDVQARFYWDPEVSREDMWVRLFEVDEALATRRPAYRGRLLNTSKVRVDCREGTELTVVSLPAGGAMAVLETVRDNLERWRCACQSCGFDLFPLRLDGVAQQQFAQAGQALEMLAFTTRCPVCNGAMLVEQREAPDNG